MPRAEASVTVLVCDTGRRRNCDTTTRVGEVTPTVGCPFTAAAASSKHDHQPTPTPAARARHEVRAGAVLVGAREARDQRRARHPRRGGARARCHGGRRCGQVCAGAPRRRCRRRSYSPARVVDRGDRGDRRSRCSSPGSGCAGAADAAGFRPGARRAARARARRSARHRAHGRGPGRVPTPRPRRAAVRAGEVEAPRRRPPRSSDPGTRSTRGR